MHRNRSDFCNLRLRCPSRTPEITVISETRERAGSAQPPPRGARWKTALRSCVRCSVCCGMLSSVFSLRNRNMLSYSCLCFICPVCRPFVIFVFRWCSGLKGRPSAGTNPQGQSWITCFINVLRFGGGSLSGGVLRPLGAQVPWNDSSRERGGPWAPPPRGLLLPRFCVHSLLFRVLLAPPLRVSALLGLC